MQVERFLFIKEGLFSLLTLTTMSAAFSVCFPKGIMLK